MESVRIIGVTGGSGSGKSTVVRRIKEAVDASVLISQDNYYKSAPFISNDNITAYNFDHPDAFDMDLMVENLADLKSGKPIMMPQIMPTTRTMPRDRFAFTKRKSKATTVSFAEPMVSPNAQMAIKIII